VMPALRWNNSIERCREVPTPGDEKNTFPELRLAVLMNSLRVFAGLFWSTTSSTAMSTSSLREMRAYLGRVRAEKFEHCQPTLARTAPSGPGWIHEIKHDGFRLLARHDPAGVRLITRNGYTWTERYPRVEEATKALRCRSCQIDGPNGRSACRL